MADFKVIGDALVMMPMTRRTGRCAFIVWDPITQLPGAKRKAGGLIHAMPIDVGYRVSSAVTVFPTNIPKYTTLSGTVKDAADNPKTNAIRIFRGANFGTEETIQTIPNSAGEFSLTVIGCQHDTFQVIACGDDGEDSPTQKGIIGEVLE